MIFNIMNYFTTLILKMSLRNYLTNEIEGQSYERFLYINSFIFNNYFNYHHNLFYHITIFVTKKNIGYTIPLYDK